MAPPVEVNITGHMKFNLVNAVEALTISKSRSGGKLGKCWCLCDQISHHFNLQMNTLQPVHISSCSMLII